MNITSSLVTKKFFFSGSRILHKFINKSFKAGKKEKFEIAFYKVLLYLSKQSKIPGIFLIFEIFEKLKPVIGLTPRVIKKKKVFVPILISIYKRYGYSFKWVRSMLDSRPFLTKLLAYKLERGFRQLSLSIKTTTCFAEKKKLYSTAVLNRVYKHFRW